MDAGTRPGMTVVTTSRHPQFIMAGQKREARPRAVVSPIQVMDALPSATQSTWIPDTRSGTTVIAMSRLSQFVMAGRGDEALLRADVPAIHVFSSPSSTTWMHATNAGMINASVKSRIIARKFYAAGE